MARSLEDIDRMMDEGDDSPSDIDASYRVTASELRAFIERAERMAAERAEIAEQEKEIFSEAKARGYDIKVMKKVIALRKRNADDVAEEGAVMEMYLDALGMSNYARV